MPGANRHGADIRLDGQVALVTGGGRGIGQAIALALSRAGAAVCACARSADQLAELQSIISGEGGHVLVIPADVLDRCAVERVVDRTERELGPIDVLVNNAGIGYPGGWFHEIDPDVWWRNLEVNVRGPVYASHAALPGMIARGRGRIINIISDIGFSPGPLVSAYCVSKTALQRLTECLARETIEQGIRVFSVHPGLVHTSLVDRALHCGISAIEEAFAGYLAEGRDIPPERAAQLVVFLASGRADALTGRYFDANEDMRLVMLRAQEICEKDLYVLRSRS